MIISRVTPSRSTYTVDQAWREIRRFHNTAKTADTLMQIHGVPEKQRNNVIKQAEQVRLSLSLARDYFEAAKVVSLTTSPVLLYYSIMHLALAEILFKQSGDSSIDRAREQHRHHGLQCSVSSAKPGQEIAVAASGLKARPMIREDGSRGGTFELGHRTARHHPTGGRCFDSRTNTNRLEALFLPANSRLPLLPEGGVDLMYCLQRIPALSGLAGSLGVSPKLVRGYVVKSVRDDSTSVFTAILHPTRPELLEAVMEQFQFAGPLCDQINVSEHGRGARIEYTHLPERPFGAHLPSSFNMSERESWFLTEYEPLNEFGFFYLSLFILGSYARYYPDKWVTDIETSSDLCLLVEELTHQAALRFPMLALSELKQSALISEQGV